MVDTTNTKGSSSASQLESAAAGAPEIEVTARMIRAGAQVIWLAFDDPSHSSYAEHVAKEVFQAMEKSRLEP